MPRKLYGQRENDGPVCDLVSMRPEHTQKNHHGRQPKEGEIHPLEIFEDALHAHDETNLLILFCRCCPLPIHANEVADEDLEKMERDPGEEEGEERRPG